MNLQSQLNTQKDISFCVLLWNSQIGSIPFFDIDITKLSTKYPSWFSRCASSGRVKKYNALMAQGNRLGVWEPFVQGNDDYFSQYPSFKKNILFWKC